MTIVYSTTLPAPDLPTPITLPDPVESDPTQLPVEPELDPANPARPLSLSGLLTTLRTSTRMRLSPHAMTTRFTANRLFMRAATFRWPTVNASLSRG